MRDARPAWAAGVLPVSLRGGRPVVLLGLDHKSKGGKWSDFAGGGEACDESPVHTALRELDEETGGLVKMRPSDLEGALEFRDTTPSGKALHRFVAWVEYDEGLPAAFRGALNDEKTRLAWFPLEALPPMRWVFGRQMWTSAHVIGRFALGHGGGPAAAEKAGHVVTAA